MTAFEFFSVALSFVLGLGITRLLLGALGVFRARHSRRPDWIPLTWGLSVLIYQIQYWWAIFELSTTIDTWTHARFLTMFSLALLLFVAGALVLPAANDRDHASLQDYFDADGRYALLALTAYSVLALWANWYLFAASPLSWIGALVATFAVTSTLAFFSRNRKMLGVLTVTYLLLAVIAYVLLAPTAY